MDTTNSCTTPSVVKPHSEQAIMNSSSASQLNLHHYKFPFATEQVAHLLADVRFVLVAGCQRRAQTLANYLAEHLSPENAKQKAESIVTPQSRLSLFKVGPALIGEHGMGSPSLLIALHELFLMCKFAGILSRITLIRFGTCGGLGVAPGTVCITDKSMDPHFQEFVELKVCQRLVQRQCTVDQKTCQLLLELANEYPHKDQLGNYEVRKGATIAANDYYEEQGRTSGAICEHTVQEERQFLEAAHNRGVINIEMESNHLAAMCHKLGVASAVVCVSLNNRFEANHLELTPDQQSVFQQRLFLVLLTFIRHKMNTE